MTGITPEIVAEHGLSPEEYQRVLHAMGREPNLTELGIFSVMWSEHCSYKSSRIHLKKLPTKAPWVICGPGENAGVISLAGVFSRTVGSVSPGRNTDKSPLSTNTSTRSGVHDIDAFDVTL